MKCHDEVRVQGTCAPDRSSYRANAYRDTHSNQHIYNEINARVAGPGGRAPEAVGRGRRPDGPCARAWPTGGAAAAPYGPSRKSSTARAAARRPAHGPAGAPHREGPVGRRVNVFPPPARRFSRNGVVVCSVFGPTDFKSQTSSRNGAYARIDRVNYAV